MHLNRAWTDGTLNVVGVYEFESETRPIARDRDAVFTKDGALEIRQIQEGMSQQKVEELLGSPQARQRYKFAGLECEEWRYPGGTLRFDVCDGQLGHILAVGVSKGWRFTAE